MPSQLPVEMLWVASIICAAYACMLILFIIGWKRGRAHSSNQVTEVKLSVVVAARNEEANITNLLHCLAAQEYPTQLVEYIIVNDASEDQTLHLCTEFAAVHPKLPLRIIDLPEAKTGNGKKRALQHGIQACSGTLIVHTDADCLVPPTWLSCIAQTYQRTKASMLLGPVEIVPEKSLFSKLQALEFMSLIGSTAATANLGHATMCNAANLAYELETYKQVNGIENTPGASGDDMYLLLKTKQLSAKRIHFIQQREAIVQTHAQPNLRAFYQQRKRWASKGKHYRDADVIATATVVVLMAVLTAGLLLTSVVLPSVAPLALAVLLFKTLLDFFLLHLVASFFGRKPLLVLVFPQQLLYVFYVVAIGLAGLLGGFEWKGRAQK